MLNRKRYPEQNPKFSEKPKAEKMENRSALTCYGCGKPGYIKAKCPSCTLSTPGEKCISNSISLYTCHASTSPTALLDIRIGDIHGRVCADTGATRSIAEMINLIPVMARGAVLGPKSESSVSNFRVNSQDDERESRSTDIGPYIPWGELPVVTSEDEVEPKLSEDTLSPKIVSEEYKRNSGKRIYSISDSASNCKRINICTR
ncbi:unnamed protein product [Larinioides sclopetarius]|uniref:CCHC-type domain-containing protein n=1 Tax=Larinioides sclopetarius TaxID=280406 RepID=A0AAV2BD35_9ARAC